MAHTPDSRHASSMAGQQGAGGRYTGFSIIDKGIGHMVNYLTERSVCKMPGCNKQCYVENNGHVHDFCGKTHAREFQAMKDAERQQITMREKRLKAVQHSHSAGGHQGAGWWGSPSYSIVAACGPGPSGPSCTRSGAQYGAHIVVNQPTIRNQYGMSQGPIRFYNRDDPYYEFTNFYLAPIDLDGKIWPTTEHYFQAQKFIGTSFPEVIRNFERPRQAFDLSRNPTVSRWRRKDWEEVKIDIMRKALLAKFTQHKRLRQQLLNTGDNMLIEHSPYDKFWGNGGDDTGENHLGMLLMEIRQYLHILQASLKQEEILVQPCLTPDSHREHIQRSASTEKDGQGSLSSSSSSCSMEYTNAEAEKTNKNEQNNHSHQEPDKRDTKNNDLTRPPLHSVTAENATVKGEGSSQGMPPSTATTGATPPQKAKDIPVANLIDLDEAGPSQEDMDNPIMNNNIPPNLREQPLQPTSLGQHANQVVKCTTQAPTMNVGKEPPSSSGDDQPEQMDTSESTE